MAGRLSEPEHEGLIRAFLQWLERVHLPARGVKLEFPPLEDRREAATMFDDELDDWGWQVWKEGWKKGWKEGWAEGWAKGRIQDQADVMHLQAARKFGAATAERLAGRLAEVADSARMEEIGEWLIECEHGDELLARVERLRASAAGGDGPPPR